MRADIGLIDTQVAAFIVGLTALSRRTERKRCPRYGRCAEVVRIGIIFAIDITSCGCVEARVGAIRRVESLRALRELQQIALGKTAIRLAHLLLIARDGDRHDDRHDSHNDHQFDQSKPTLRFAIEHGHLPKNAEGS